MYFPGKKKKKKFQFQIQPLVEDLSLSQKQVIVEEDEKKKTLGYLTDIKNKKIRLLNNVMQEYTLQFEVSRQFY